MRLHIECHREGNAELEELGIEQKVGTEFRPCEINPEHIAFYYPNTSGGTFIEFIGGTQITVKETFDKLCTIL